MPPRNTSEPCWNCWQLHPFKSCPDATRGPRQRENLRILLKVPNPSEHYRDLTRRLLSCYNCWTTTAHEADECPRPKLSTFDRELLRQRREAPMSPKWQKILGEQGVRVDDVREHLRRGELIGGSMIKQGSLLPDKDRDSRLQRRLENWDNSISAFRYESGLHEILVAGWGPEGPVTYARELPSPTREKRSPTRYGSYSGTDDEEEREEEEDVGRDCCGLGDDDEEEEVASEAEESLKQEYDDGRKFARASSQQLEESSQDQHSQPRGMLRAAAKKGVYDSHNGVSSAVMKKNSMAKCQPMMKNMIQNGGDPGKDLPKQQPKESLAELLDRRTGYAAAQAKKMAQKDKPTSADIIDSDQALDCLPQNVPRKLPNANKRQPTAPTNTKRKNKDDYLTAAPLETTASESLPAHVTSSFSAKYTLSNNKFDADGATLWFSTANNHKRKNKSNPPTITSRELAASDRIPAGIPSSSSAKNISFNRFEANETAAWSFNKTSFAFPTTTSKHNSGKGDLQRYPPFEIPKLGNDRLADPKMKEEVDADTNAAIRSPPRSTIKKTREDKSKVSKPAPAKRSSTFVNNNNNTIDLLSDIEEEENHFAVLKPLQAVLTPLRPALQPTIPHKSTIIKTEDKEDALVSPQVSWADDYEQNTNLVKLKEGEEEEDDYELTEGEEAELLELAMELRDAIKEYRATVLPMMVSVVQGLKQLKKLYMEEWILLSFI